MKTHKKTWEKICTNYMMKCAHTQPRLPTYTKNKNASHYEWKHEQISVNISFEEEQKIIPVRWNIIYNRNANGKKCAVVKCYHWTEYWSEKLRFSFSLSLVLAHKHRSIDRYLCLKTCTTNTNKQTNKERNKNQIIIIIIKLNMKIKLCNTLATTCIKKLSLLFFCIHFVLFLF